MIQIEPTPNYAGVSITGDFYDFDQLYESLHTVVGQEGELIHYHNARMRVLGLCYNLRHTNMGHREYEFKDHGLDKETMKWLGVVGSDKNLYLSFKTYYPEMLFIVLALNDFIDIHERKTATNRIWDKHVTTVRAFQAAVMDSLSKTLKNQTFKMLQNNMSHKYGPSVSGYFTQYLDELNVKFLSWDKEKRLKNISVIGKRLAEQGKPYEDAVRSVLQVAKEDNVDPSSIVYKDDYPDYEDIDW
jgi:hypothetical protein